jgi:hypothetical protein
MNTSSYTSTFPYMPITWCLIMQRENQFTENTNLLLWRQSHLAKPEVNLPCASLNIHLLKNCTNEKYKINFNLVWQASLMNNSELLHQFYTNWEVIGLKVKGLFGHIPNWTVKVQLQSLSTVSMRWRWLFCFRSMLL